MSKLKIYFKSIVIPIIIGGIIGFIISKSLDYITIQNKTIQNIDISILVWFFDSGGPRGIRTPDPTLRRRVLYPTELLAHFKCRYNYNAKSYICQLVLQKKLK